MEKIIKNTIEDFTDDQEIIEIEKLMLEKKYDEALKKLGIYGNEIYDKFPSLTPQPKEETSCKAVIISISMAICSQYIDLGAAIYNLIIINNACGSVSLGILLLFNDILHKMESGYYEKQNTELGNQYIAKIELTTKRMINKIENQIQKILEIEDYIPSKEELIIKYLYNKFQK